MNVYFLAGAFPAENSFLLIQVMNWAAKNKFKIFNIINLLLPISNNGILHPSNKNNISLQSINMVYIESSRENFKKYFDFEYDENKLTKIPQLIKEKQEAKI